MLPTIAASEGGAYVGEGAVACAFLPAPPCVWELDPAPAAAKPRRRRMLGKVVPDLAVMAHEWEVTRPLVRADPDQELLLYPVGRCTTTRGRVAAADPLGLRYCTVLSPLVYHPQLSPAERNAEVVGLLRVLYGGPNLYEWARARRRVSPTDYLRIFYQAARALERLSAAGLVHQDLKPDNLVVSGRGTSLRVRIIDFSLAQRRRDLFDPVANGAVLAGNHWSHPPEYRVMARLYEAPGGAPMTPAEVAGMVATEAAIGQVLLGPEQKETLTSLRRRVLPDEAYLRSYTSAYAAKSPASLTERARRYANRADVLGLGWSMLYLATYTYVQGGKAPVAALLARMLSPDPAQRPSPAALVRALASALAPAAPTGQEERGGDRDRA